MSEDTSDEDWFETALDDEGSDDSTDADTPDTDADPGAGAPADTDEVDGDSDSDEADPATDAASAAQAADDTQSSADSSGGDPFGSGGGTDDANPFDGDSDASGGEDLFGGSDGAESGGDPFGDSASEPSNDPFGGDESGEGLFDEDIESAFGGGGSEEFDDDSLDTEIPRVNLGIEGLDAMIHGGVPERHLMVTIGSAGTGKTTFGLQFLHYGLENGENVVFITLEQSRDAIISTAEERGWDFAQYAEEGSLAVVDLDPVEMANSLDNIRGEMPELIMAFDADRLVLDSVSLLEMMYDEQAKRRTEVFDFTRSLKQAGVTTMLTSEASEDNAYASRHGIIEYLTDAVFILQYVRTEATETRLAVEIQKIRNANHSRETKPYEITLDGISVYDQANIF
jgi:KaiC domain protein